MSEIFKILSLNVHKGFSHFNSRYILPELRDALRSLEPDIVFLQEVLGENHLKTIRFSKAPQKPQYEYLADSVWSDFAYGKNAVYPEGHHGNAVLSKFPIHTSQQHDISTHSLEQRGILHCEIFLPRHQKLIHCLCVHLGLLSFHRKKQFEWIVGYVRNHIPDDAPLILAGDLNDWSNHADKFLAKPLQLEEAFLKTRGKLARSFPCYFPLLTLDRIYSRHLTIQSADVVSQTPWKHLSDHAALLATLRYEKILG
jgi:endonuclease/exonuclease/phosphatase family metal-dependent hydrolase